MIEIQLPIPTGYAGNRIIQQLEAWEEAEGPNTVLTDDDVRVMRELHNEGVSASLIASEFGVSHWYAARIVRGAERP